ncbi:MAG: sulfotransferase [Erythrobacter sp.]
MLEKLTTLLQPHVPSFNRRRRGCPVYGVGAAKTGTHSLAAMFEPYVASEHEPDQIELIELLLDREQTGVSRQLYRFLRERGKRHPLKVNASQINIYLLGEILELHPDAKFVLTTRHPLDWVRSIIDDSLRRDIGNSWRRFRDFRFGMPAKLGGPDDSLARAGLYTLEGYFSYWSQAMRIPLGAIQNERLLIVRTEQLFDTSEQIADFCEISGFVPDEKKSHAFANPFRSGLLGELGKGHVLSTMERVCGGYLRKHFSDIDAVERFDALTQEKSRNSG